MTQPNKMTNMDWRGAIKLTDFNINQKLVQNEVSVYLQ